MWVERGRLSGRDAIGVRVGEVVNKYKVAKHFALDIEDQRFGFHRLQDNITSEAALDGIYIIRTSVAKKQMTAADCVRNYKSLAEVERAFRSLKTIDLKIRPIHHHLADRVRSHIFLCMLAYYVEWHMREAWRPLLFADEDQLAKTTRDPVAAAKRSAPAQAKAASHLLEDGTPRAQLLHPSTGARYHRPQHLPRPANRRRCPNLQDHHHCEPKAAPRPRTPQRHPLVDRTPQT